MSVCFGWKEVSQVNPNLADRCIVIPKKIIRFEKIFYTETHEKNQINSFVYERNFIWSLCSNKFNSV